VEPSLQELAFATTAGDSLLGSLRFCVSESLPVTHPLVLLAISGPRKINGAACKSRAFSVAYESAEGKFIRP
jgi:hypothetical protein